MRVVVFAHGRDAFLALLRQNRIDFLEEQLQPGTFRAAGEAITIVETAIPAIATVLVAWLKARSNRKIILQTGLKTVHLEGYSIEQATKALEAASGEKARTTAMVIQTDQD